MTTLSNQLVTLSQYSSSASSLSPALYLVHACDLESRRRSDAHLRAAGVSIGIGPRSSRILSQRFPDLARSILNRYAHDSTRFLSSSVSSLSGFVIFCTLLAS